ncbi:type II 3-dehydroquinate dehydratase [Hugenholtzia roseola]|uniref:type II 3-dehydroquinate dehydratase n=1 Tax=Hugenholtzia roseola TaxID=1002 RepID=UPI0004192354|nr:type II 3-dehydroquinate dehydratase [Hugenholtzia roseola]
MKIAIINGANLNLLGKREPEIYGSLSFETYFKSLQDRYPNLALSYFQSNHEGALIDYIQQVGFSHQGLVINAGAYTHTSLAIADAVRAVPAPAVEVHISNIFGREAFRHHSFLSAVCVGMITGLGLEGYRLAIEFLQKDA